MQRQDVCVGFLMPWVNQVLCAFMQAGQTCIDMRRSYNNTGFWIFSNIVNQQYELYSNYVYGTVYVCNLVKKTDGV